MVDTRKKNDNIVPFEQALDRAGFGLYSFSMAGLASLITISFVCISYGTTILIPANACELETTVAQQGLLASGPMIGLILGGVGWGYLSDMKGRKNVLFLTLISSGVINALASISVNWIMLLILQFLAATLGSGKFTLVMTLLSESVPAAKRNSIVLVVGSVFLLAQGFIAVLAVPIIPLRFSYHLSSIGIYWNSWRTLMLVYSVPSILCTIWLLFMQESPKFVYNKGDDERALQILVRIYGANNRRSKEKFQIKGFIREDINEKAPEVQISALFKTPLLKNTLLITILMCQQAAAFSIWLPTIANQFVTLVQTGEGSDLNLCKIIDASLDAPLDPDAIPCSIDVFALLIVFAISVGHFLISGVIALIVNKLGYRNMVIFVAAVCGACGIIVNMIPNAFGSAVLFGIFMMGIIVVGMYTAMIVALYPTHLRALAVALIMTLSRIAIAINVLILNWLLATNCELGFYLFTAIFTLSAPVAWFLPDDRYRIGKPVAKKEKNEPEIAQQVLSTAMSVVTCATVLYVRAGF